MLLNRLIFILIYISSFIAGCSNDSVYDHIEVVKNGKLEFNDKLTIGEVFDNYEYLSGIKWDFFKNYKNETYVLMTGIIDNEILEKYFEIANKNTESEYRTDLSKVELKVQFAISNDGKSFKLSFVGYFGYSEDGEKICESSGDIEKISIIFKNEMSQEILKWCTGPVAIVKNMKTNSEHTMTIGEAFDNYNYFNKIEWSSKQKDERRIIVTMTGTYDEKIEKYYMGKILNPTRAFLIIEFEVNKNNKMVDLKNAKIIGYLEDGTKVKGTIPMKFNIPAVPIEIVLPIYNNEVFDKDMLKTIMWAP